MERTLWLLRAVYDRIGAAGYQKLVEAYPRCGVVCGFSEADILSVKADAPLDLRSNEYEAPTTYMGRHNWR